MSMDARILDHREEQKSRYFLSRRATLAVTAILASLGLVLGVAAPASARSANGWVWSHSAGQTQLYTTLGDKSTHMSRATVQHLHGAGLVTTYCGAQAKVSGTLASGAGWSRVFGYQSGCWFVMVDETTSPNVYFKAGSNFYGQAYHDGAWSPGSASIRP